VFGIIRPTAYFCEVLAEPSLAEQSLYRSWRWNTGIVLDKHSGYLLSCSGSCDGSFKNWRAWVSNLRVRVMHTEAVEVATGISFVIGLWSAATFPKLSDFSNRPQWCRQPSDFEVWMSSSGHNKCFHCTLYYSEITYTWCRLTFKTNQPTYLWVVMCTYGSSTLKMCLSTST